MSMATALPILSSASVPEGIRGYGHVKERHLDVAEAHQKQLLQAFRNPETRQTAAE